eukprot:Awhi_evm1s2813
MDSRLFHHLSLDCLPTNENGEAQPLSPSDLAKLIRMKSADNPFVHVTSSKQLSSDGIRTPSTMTIEELSSLGNVVILDCRHVAQFNLLHIK